MAWGAPRTWVVGELVTAAMMNQDVRDNSIYLKAEVDKLYTVSRDDTANAKDTIYQNVSGKIRIVTVTVGLRVANDDQGEILLENVTPPTVIVAQMHSDTGHTLEMPVTFVVPAGWYYECETVNGVISIIDWHEWDLF